MFDTDSDVRAPRGCKRWMSTARNNWFDPMSSISSPKIGIRWYQMWGITHQYLASQGWDGLTSLYSRCLWRSPIQRDHVTMTKYLNTQTLPLPRPPILDTDPLFEATPPEEYDLNSIIPIPKQPLETNLVRVEPLIVSSEYSLSTPAAYELNIWQPSIHGERLAEEFMRAHDEPDVFFYPFPYGRPYSEGFKPF